MTLDPPSRLYDAACEILLAAQELTAASRLAGSGAGAAATLGALGEALAELADASVAIGPEALTEALDAARDACEAARAGAAHAAFSGPVGPAG